MNFTFKDMTSINISLNAFRFNARIQNRNQNFHPIKVEYGHRNIPVVWGASQFHFLLQI